MAECQAKIQAPAVIFCFINSAIRNMIKLYFTLIKSRTFILLAVLMPLLYFISSCSENKGFSPVFEDVESGIARDSLDLAMNILDSIERTHNKRESDHMEAAFLELQINDRSYKPHRSDSTIKRLLEYYIDGNRNPRLHPSLLYYAGRVYSDMGRDNDIS